MAITTQFLGSAGLLQVFGDAHSNSIIISRDADGTLRVNGKTIVDNGVIATVNNTTLISVFGNAGNDRITLDESNGPLPKANLFGGAGNDIITGGSGTDQLFGEAGNDTLEGKGGNDLLSGGDGNDVLTGGAGSDQMFGGAGDDKMIWNPGDGSDVAEGGSGTDTLEVNGANGGETFTIAANGTRVRVDRIDPAPFSIDANDIEEIVIKGNGGDDTFSAIGNLAALTHLTLDGGDGNDTILGGNGDDLLIGGNGNDFIDGQQGSDTVRLGAGDDVFQWDPGDGSDEVEGEAGFDTLVFNGSNGTENFTISANGKRAVLTRDLGNITMDLNGIERIELNALGESDTITVNDLTGTAVKEVAIDLGGVDGNPDQEFDMVAINGTNKNDKINITANGSSIVVTGLAATVTITGADANADTRDTLLVMAGKGNDTIDASTLPAGMHLVINGDDGHDTITGGAGGDTLHGGTGNDKIDGGGGNDLVFLGEGNDVFTWNPGDGSDEVIGGDGVDVLDFVGSGQDEKITISATPGGDVQFLRDVGAITMNLMEMERIEFDALAGTDEIVVNDLSGTTVKDVVIDLGPADGVADSITVNGTDGADHISVVSSGNSVLVNGLAADVTIKHSEGGLDTLIINGVGGNDTIDASGLKPGLVNLVINGGLGNDVITGSRGDDVINGGAGNDIMRGGAGDDTFVWNPGDGSDVIDGQSGIDTQVFNGSNAAEIFNISALADGDVQLTRNIGLITQNLDGVETIELNALGGGDTIVIGDLTGTDVKDVHVTLAATGDGDEAADTVVINGTEGDDIITLTIENGSLVINGLAGKIVIDNFDPELDKIQIAGLGGNDIIDASAIAGLAPQLMLEGGEGNDVLLGGAGNDVLLGGNGDDVLLGGPGNDVVDGEGGDDVEIQDLSGLAQLQDDPAAAVFQNWIESSAVKDLHLL